MLIKQGPHRSRRDTLAGCEEGFTPAYKKTFEGVGRSIDDRNAGRRRYGKNIMLLQGKCKGCENLKKTNKVNDHCKLPESKHCPK